MGEVQRKAFRFQRTGVSFLAGLWQVAREDFSVEVMSCQIHSPPWEEWDLRKVAGHRSLLSREGRKLGLEMLIIP